MTALGSCVSACIRDPVAGVGGVNHFMLPHSDAGAWDTEAASLRYGNFAMPRLINDILQQGGHSGRLEIKLFGGARLGGDRGRIGGLNVSFVERYLQGVGLPWVVAEVGGTVARRLIYMPVSGRAFVLELPAQTLLRQGDEPVHAKGQRMPPALQGGPGMPVTGAP
ncbi:chemotaxis protein CheD [Lichenicola sp.]|uniref:chemotaxis protein CheD n=1 Tax=Lichenicola sp. TaxID=2804529 RepID=UPI003AFFC978